MFGFRVSLLCGVKQDSVPPKLSLQSPVNFTVHTADAIQCIQTPKSFLAFQRSRRWERRVATAKTRESCRVTVESDNWFCEDGRQAKSIELEQSCHKTESNSIKAHTEAYKASIQSFANLVRGSFEMMYLADDSWNVVYNIQIVVLHTLVIIWNASSVHKLHPRFVWREEHAVMRLLEVTPP
jgi:hypothetical protein